jgi:putative heme-binding domain-containing protein
MLKNLSREATGGIGRLHALNALRAAGVLTTEDIRDAARDRNEAVRVHAVHFAAESEPALADVLRLGASDSDLRVRYAAALAEDDSITLTKIISRDVEHPWMRAAVLNGLSNGAAEVFAALAGKKEFLSRSGAIEFLREAARIAGASAPISRVRLGLRVATNSPRVLTFATAFGSGLERRALTLAAADPTLFARLIERSRAMAADSAAPEAERVEAIEFLGSGFDAESRATLLAMLAPRYSTRLQSVAVIALNKRRDNSMTNVLARWPELSRDTRTKAVTLLLSRRDSALALVNAVEQGIVAHTELNASDVQRLTTHADRIVRDKAQSVFQRDNIARVEVVKRFQPALGMKGDAERGHATYRQRCAMCHRAGREGFAVGPDLTSMTANGKEKILTSILDPNAEVAAAYVAYSVETRQGESFLGVLAAENSLAVLLKVPNGETIRLGRESIVSMRGSEKSLMPEGLEEGLDAQALADMLEFVLQAKPAP